MHVDCWKFVEKQNLYFHLKISLFYYQKVTKKMTSFEQRELLKLLTQNFEYEMKTVELQAEIFARDYSIKHKDLQLLRMSQHRSLCDTLIYQQRRLIQGILIE